MRGGPFTVRPLLSNGILCSLPVFIGAAHDLPTRPGDCPGPRPVAHFPLQTCGLGRESASPSSSPPPGTPGSPSLDPPERETAYGHVSGTPIRLARSRSGPPRIPPGTPGDLPGNRCRPGPRLRGAGTTEAPFRNQGFAASPSPTTEAPPGNYGGAEQPEPRRSDRSRAGRATAGASGPRERRRIDRSSSGSRGRRRTKKRDGAEGAVLVRIRGPTRGSSPTGDSQASAASSTSFGVRSTNSRIARSPLSPRRGLLSRRIRQ